MPVFQIEGDREFDRFNSPTVVYSRSVNNNLQCSASDPAAGAPVTNPFVGTLIVTDLETADTFSLNDELQKIDNFTASTALVTNIAGRLNVGDVATNTITDAGDNVFIQLDATDINFQATNVTINSSDIVVNPMLVALNADSNDIINVNNLIATTINTDSMISGLTNVEFINPVSTSALMTINGGVDVYSTSTYNGNNITDVNNFSASNVECKSSLQVSSPFPTVLTTNASAGFTIDPAGFFNISKVSGLTVVPMLSITDATKINMTIDLDMNNNPINNVSLINGITPAGGLYMTTSDANIISGTVTQTSLFAGASFTPATGLTVPANAFQISSYHFNMSGNISTNNGNTLTLSLYNGGILASFVVPLTGSSNEFFELEADFSIRTLGVATVASISTNFDLTYSDSGATAWRGKRTCVVNNTTFDTTVSNTLDVRAQWSSTSSNNSIQCRQAILTRTF